MSNPDSLFIDKDTLFKLTGRRRKRAQVAWLKKNGHGIRWWVNDAGAPVVPKSNFEAQAAQTSTAQPAAPSEETWVPNVLRARAA